MSSAKFASITANLLARKGDAAPSLATLPTRPSAFGDREPPFPPPPPRDFTLDMRSEPVAGAAPKAQPEPVCKAAAPSPVPADQGDKPRRIVVTLSAEEFERLSIASIKKDMPRHGIVHAALDAYFHQLASELPRRCNCMAEGGCCG